MIAYSGISVKRKMAKENDKNDEYNENKVSLLLSGKLRA
jgi:hypothetical protein